MIANDKNQKLSFGWKHTTHRLISSAGVERFNKLVSRASQISHDIVDEACVAPDFNRRELPKNLPGHFANIDKPRDVPADALNLVRKYAKKALQAHRNFVQTDSREEINRRDKYIGYALHFLQDMLNPHHVDFEPLPKEHPERIAHKAFESLAQKMENQVIKNTPLPDTPEQHGFFRETLPNAMRVTKSRWDRVKTLDVPPQELNGIARDSLKTTHQTTDSFLGGLARKMNEIEQEHLIGANLDIAA
jgi:hypothetical protein